MMVMMMMIIKVMMMMMMIKVLTVTMMLKACLLVMCHPDLMICHPVLTSMNRNAGTLTYSTSMNRNAGEPVQALPDYMPDSTSDHFRLLVQALPDYMPDALFRTLPSLHVSL